MIKGDKIIRYESKEAWEAEGRRRFGEDFMKWRFICPMCGHIASIEEFKAAGCSDPNEALSCCLGRFTGKGSPKKGDSSGCNWTVYGFLKIGGAYVMHNGEEFLIFDFAPVSEEEAIDNGGTMAKKKTVKEADQPKNLPSTHGG